MKSFIIVSEKKKKKKKAKLYTPPIVSWADNSVTSNIDEICPLAILIQIYFRSMHVPTTKFGLNPLTITQVIIQKQKYGCVSGR